MNASDPLKKVHPLYNLIKTKALEHYQPLCELSVDERMVKSKARTHFRQILPKKLIKWGFKYWVVVHPGLRFVLRSLSHFADIREWINI